MTISEGSKLVPRINVSNGQLDIRDSTVSNIEGFPGGDLARGDINVQDSELQSIRVSGNIDKFTLRNSVLAPQDETAVRVDLSQSTSSSIAIFGNEIKNERTGIEVRGTGTQDLSISKNTFLGSEKYPHIRITLDQILLSSLNGNRTASGDPLRLLVQGELAEDYDLRDLDAILYIRALGLASGVTLQAGPGTQILSHRRLESGSRDPAIVSISPDSVVDFAGSAERPVIVGDSEFEIPIEFNDSNIHFRNVLSAGSLSGWGGSATVTDSTLGNFYISGADSANLRGSTVNGAVTVRRTEIVEIIGNRINSETFGIEIDGSGYIEVALVEVLHNTIDLTAAPRARSQHLNRVSEGTGLYYQGHPRDVTPLVIGNHVVSAPAEAFQIAAHPLDIAKIAGNSSTGSGDNAVFYGGTLSDRLVVSPDDALGTGIMNSGFAHPGASGLTIKSGEMLVKPGSEILFAPRHGCLGCSESRWAGIYVEDGGQFRAGDVGADSISFRVGRSFGHLNGPIWNPLFKVGGVHVSKGGVAVMRSVDMAVPANNQSDEPGTALSVQKNSDATLIFTHGSIDYSQSLDAQSSTAVDGCPIGPPSGLPDKPRCSVDVSNVDWGTPSGPYPAGIAPKICGVATVSPWVGQASQLDGWESYDCSPTGSADQLIASELAWLCDQIGDLTACHTTSGYKSCLDEITRLAWQLDPKLLSEIAWDDADAEQLREAGAMVTANVTEYLSNYGTSDLIKVGAASFRMMSAVYDAVSTYHSLDSTADSCRSALE